MRKMLILFLIFIPVSVAQAQTPSQVYEAYNKRVIAGLAFDDEIPYFSKRKWAEAQDSLTEIMKQGNKSRDEVIEVYSTVSQQIQQCMSISLREENIAGNRATVIYAQTDICNKDPGSTVAGKRIITMVDEDGWKIDEIEMKF